jgi:hypothetical protein
MAVTTVYSSSRGFVRHVGSIESDVNDAFDDSRGTNTTTGTSVGSTGASVAWGVGMETTRGGDFQGTIYRCYFYFDLGDIGSDDVTAVTFTFKNLSNANGEGIVVRANSDNDFGTIATSDFPLVFNSSTSMTAYSGTFTPSLSGLALSSVALNATAISNINSGGSSKEICVGIINNTYDFDYPDVEESFGNLFNGVDLTTSGANRAVMTVTHESSGFGKDVNGVTAANIVKVNDVASASIVKLNDVPA